MVTLSDSGSKNIENYNQAPGRMGMAPMPYIVAVVDELADLMLADLRATEDAITRIAQMSRAVGIHLVLATQRPSVDVITGVTKANMHARIAFQVASQFDARTILDAKGAESLIGRGDMLYLSPSASNPIRLQGAHVDEEELRRVIDFIRGQMTPIYVDLDDISDNVTVAAERTLFRSAGDRAEEIDPQLYEECKRFVIQLRKVSTSILQKKFHIGLNKAEKIIELLEKDGIVGPPKGSAPRKVITGATDSATDIDPKLYADAKQFVVGLREAWVWMLENKFGIARRQAEKIIEMLKEEGIYGGEGRSDI